MSDDARRYEVVTADPGGYWLMQRGSTDPSRWAWMEHENPVEEIDRLRAELAEKDKLIEQLKEIVGVHQDRIEELESAHIITDEQIDAAWGDKIDPKVYPEEIVRVYIPADALSIHACNACGGDGVEKDDDGDAVGRCPVCAEFSGRGWVMGGRR